MEQSMECNLPPPSLSSAAVMPPPPPSNSRKQPQQMQHTYGAQPQRTGRPRRAEKPPPVAYSFLEDNQPTAAPRLSAASITPIAPSVRQSTFSDLDDALRPSPVAADRPPLPPFPPLLSPTGHPPKPSEAERYKQRYLNRRTLPAPAPSTTFAAAAANSGRPRTQSLGSASASAASAASASSTSTSTSTGEPQRSTAGHRNHHHQTHHHRKRTPSNPTLEAIVERPLPATPRRIPVSQDARNHVHFHTHPAPKSAPHPTPSDPPRLAKISDDLRGPSQPHPQSASPTSTLVHSASPLQERSSSPKTPSKKRLFPINKNFNKLFRRGRSASVDCHDTTNPNPTATSNEPQKRPTTPTPAPNKFSSLPAISTSDISRPIVRRSTSHLPTSRPRYRNAEVSAALAAVKRVRRVTPLTEVDLDSKKEWRSSFMKERKVPVYHPPADWPYASHDHHR